MRAEQEKECQELQKTMMERKQKLTGEVPEFRETVSIYQGLGRQDLGGGIGFAGEGAGDGGAVEGKEQYRSGGVDSCC